MRVDIDSYIGLIRDYLDGGISSKCFEYIYLKTFIEEKRKMTNEEHSVLSGLFMDVEAFCDNPELIDENDIDEVELRRRCKVALERLRKMKQLSSDD